MPIAPMGGESPEIPEVKPEKIPCAGQGGGQTCLQKKEPEALQDPPGLERRLILAWWQLPHNDIAHPGESNP